MTKNLITRLKKTRSTKSEKWRHTCNSVKIAWTNEQKVAVTSYGRNKNHDEIKKTKRRPIIAPAIAVRLLNRKTNRLASDKLFSKNKLGSWDSTLRPPEHLAEAFTHCLSGPCAFLRYNRFYFSNKLYFRVRAIDITQKWRSTMKKSLVKTGTFTIFAWNSVKKQLSVKTSQITACKNSCSKT